MSELVDDYAAMSDRRFLMEIFDILAFGERSGAARDEPEGTRYLMLSDTLAKHLAARLQVVIRRLK